MPASTSSSSWPATSPQSAPAAAVVVVVSTWLGNFLHQDKQQQHQTSQGLSNKQQHQVSQHLF
jgi:negative regulator of sigma E activity